MIFANFDFLGFWGLDLVVFLLRLGLVVDGAESWLRSWWLGPLGQFWSRCFDCALADANSLQGRAPGWRLGAEVVENDGRAKQAVERLGKPGQIGVRRFAGAKALFILLALSARLKSCPDKKQKCKSNKTKRNCKMPVSSIAGRKRRWRPVTEPSRASLSAACKSLEHF